MNGRWREIASHRDIRAPPKILFVCLGNICRSPLAEAAFRAAATDAGLQVVVDSAGTSNWHVGEPPDQRAQAVARRHGLDISHLRGRQVEPADIGRFTHIFALDSKNLAKLQALAVSEDAATPTPAKIALLLDLLPGREGQGVVDPYGGADAAFEATWRDVEVAARALVRRLAR